VQTYKAQLQRHLVDHGWEVVEVNACDDWWADEFWKVQSRRNSWGFELVLTFLVDPQWETPGKKRQGVWLIAATEAVPTDRLVAEAGIGHLHLGKGRFDEKLKAFVASLDTHRINREQAKHGQT
jgi:hypothetical protein